MTIAGSDSGGGAGIQADLKAFAACGTHGTSAIVALTAQSTTGVTGVHTVPPEFVLEQVRTVASDIRIDAVKTGMLGDAATIAAVTQAIGELDPATPLVVDPVMVAESGATLLAAEAIEALTTQLLPRATVVTPNVPEAARLTGLRGGADAETLARALHALGPRHVVVTGGHRDEATDLLFDGTTLTAIPGERYPDGAAHGSGCTHASALAAHLAHGFSVEEAARAARRIAGEAVRHGLREIGRGPGPVDVLGVADRRPGPPSGAL
jgi:hydroxymethylpyrimidine/phosphomethylpyrimidine kinase